MIPPNAELDFEVTVDGVKKELKIEVLKQVDCESDKKTREKDKISVHYNATLANGNYLVIPKLSIILHNEQTFCVQSRFIYIIL